MIRGAGWRWWLTESCPVHEARVTSGEPIALIGDASEALRTWAQSIGPERRVLDLRDPGRPPTVRAVERAFDGASPIILAARAEHVVRALGLAHQPYLVAAVPLSARPGDALALLQAAIDELTPNPLSLDALGERAADLATYHWPGGLAEIRRTARVVAALLETHGNLTAASRRLGVSRQSVQRFMGRRR